MRSSSIRSIAVLGMLLAGCDALFGLDHISSTTDAAQPDTPLPVTVTGHYGWLVIAPTLSGSIMTSEQHSRPNSLRVVLDSGAQPTITFDAADEFSFPLERGGQGYRLIYQGAPSDVPIEIQDTAASVPIVFPIYGRPLRTPITAPTNLNFTIINSPTGGTSLVSSTGIRTRTIVGGPFSTFTFDWRNAGVVSGPAGLLDASKGDVVYYGHYQDNTTEHCFFVDVHGPAQVTLTNGTSASVTISMTNVPAPHCVAFTPKRDDELKRLMTVWPLRSGDTTATAWQIVSVARPELTPQGGIPVVYNNDTESPGEQHRVNYGNPYANETQILQLITRITHYVAIPGTSQAATINYETTHWFEVTDNCSGPPIDMTGAVGIPVVPTLGGQPILENGVVMLDRSLPVPLDFPTVVPGKIDVYDVILFELDGIGNATVPKPIYHWRVFGPRVMVDPALLVSGTSYTFAVAAYVGLPKVAERVFTEASYPAGSATVFTPAFKAP